MRLKYLLFFVFVISTAFQCENDDVNQTSNPNNEQTPNEDEDEDNEPVFTPVSWIHGTGTESDPYLIENKEQLAYLSQRVNDITTEQAQFTINRFEGKYFKIINDINMQGVPFQAIGKSNNFPFKGNIDGNFKTISNLKINSVVENDATGLFGFVWSTIKNIQLVNCNIAGMDYVGGITGKASAGSIKNCSVDGVIFGNYKIGGIVGQTNGSALIQSCSFEGDLKGIVVGGIVGDLTSYGKVSKCYNNGVITGFYNGGTPITGQNPCAGGIVGEAYLGTVDKCYNKGKINGFINVGGIVGNWSGSNASNAGNAIYNCYNKGSINASNGPAASIIGYKNIGSSIHNCYNIGHISCNNRNLVDPIAYNSYTTSVHNSYFLYGITHNQFQFDPHYGLTENYMKSGNFLNDLHYTSNCTCETGVIWKIDANGIKNNGFPYLAWEDE